MYGEPYIQAEKMTGEFTTSAALDETSNALVLNSNHNQR
jgi:hypothetical protein